jgi:membrane-bound lytic murein transglycosylase D
MESRLCRFLLSFLILVLCHTVQANTIAEIPPMPSDEDIKTRLIGMPCLVDVHYSSDVKNGIEDYVIQHRAIGEMILGRSAIYFPVFEKLLKENGLPTDLKYLAVIESTLIPTATSRVGAGGLWQFMPKTALNYGLRVDKVMDERAEMYKSTEAAVKHLKKLYDLYNDWELVLAAYNSGTGKVAEAMRLSGSKSWSRIANYLPLETRKFIPRYIAVTYVFNYYTEHNLKPQLPDLDLQLTTTTKVFDHLTLARIADATDLPFNTVKSLNAAYKEEYIPASNDGYNLVLPRRVMDKFQQFISSPDAKITPKTIVFSEDYDSSDKYLKTVYTVMADDNLEKIAEWMNCSTHQIKLWNNLSGNKLSKDKELVLYLPDNGQRQEIEARTVAALLALPAIKVNALVTSDQSSQEKFLPFNYTSPQKVEYEYHLIRPGESLWDIAQLYEGMTIKDLMVINSIDGKVNIAAGNLIRIKRLVEDATEVKGDILAQQ